MLAVVFEGPRKVGLQTRPIPKGKRPCDPRPRPASDSRFSSERRGRRREGQRERPLRLVRPPAQSYLGSFPASDPTLRAPLPEITRLTLRRRELHVFRGLETPKPGFIFGHEFTGTVVEAGADVRSVQVGDKVVSPFTVSW